VQISVLSQFCRYLSTAWRKLRVEDLVLSQFCRYLTTAWRKLRVEDLEEPSQRRERLFGLTRNMARDPSGMLYCELPTGGAFVASPNEVRKKEFLVDSGASFHMAWNEEDLICYGDDVRNYTEPPISSFGGFGPGSIKVTRSGYFKSDRILLHGILLADRAQVNLVSVGQLTHQYCINMQMDHEKVIITNQSDGAQIGGGIMNECHHYVLEYFLPGGGLYGPLRRRSNNWFGKSHFTRPPQRIFRRG